MFEKKLQDLGLLGRTWLERSKRRKEFLESRVVRFHFAVHFDEGLSVGKKLWSRFSFKLRTTRKNIAEHINRNFDSVLLDFSNRIILSWIPIAFTRVLLQGVSLLQLKQKKSLPSVQLHFANNFFASKWSSLYRLKFWLKCLKTWMLAVSEELPEFQNNGAL